MIYDDRTAVHQMLIWILTRDSHTNRFVLVQCDLILSAVFLSPSLSLSLYVSSLYPIGFPSFFALLVVSGCFWPGTGQLRQRLFLSFKKNEEEDQEKDKEKEDDRSTAPPPGRIIFPMNYGLLHYHTHTHTQTSQHRFFLRVLHLILIVVVWVCLGTAFSSLPFSLFPVWMRSRKPFVEFYSSHSSPFTHPNTQTFRSLLQHRKFTDLLFPCLHLRFGDFLNQCDLPILPLLAFVLARFLSLPLSLSLSLVFTAPPLILPRKSHQLVVAVSNPLDTCKHTA